MLYERIIPDTQRHRERQVLLTHLVIFAVLNAVLLMFSLWNVGPGGDGVIVTYIWVFVLFAHLFHFANRHLDSPQAEERLLLIAYKLKRRNDVVPREILIQQVRGFLRARMLLVAHVLLYSAFNIPFIIAVVTAYRLFVVVNAFWIAALIVHLWYYNSRYFDNQTRD